AGIFAVQLYQVCRGAISFFLNKPDVVLLLKLEHLVFSVSQIFFRLNELFGDARDDSLSLAFTHSLFEIEILLHKRIQISLRVVRVPANCLKIENGSARFLNDGEVHAAGLQFRMSGTSERLSTALDLRALH